MLGAMYCRWLVLVVTLFSSVAFAASSETAQQQLQRSAEIYKTTMSPFCPGRTLDACPSPNATAWRDDIRQWVSEGLSTEEIRRRLGQRTEQDLTGAPSTALDAVLPFGATVLSLVLLGVLLRLLVKPNTVVSAATTGGVNSAPSSGRETFATKEEGKTSTHEKVSEEELEARLKRELEQLDD
jgi:cytochrome c-type biogenesis protein CcmH/NrfF